MTIKPPGRAYGPACRMCGWDVVVIFMDTPNRGGPWQIFLCPRCDAPAEGGGPPSLEWIKNLRR